MPNHVTNVIRVKDLGSASLSDVHARFLNEKRFVDFNVILAMPACLKDFEPHSGILSIANAKLNTPLHDDTSPLGRLMAPLEQENRDKAMEKSDELSDADKAMVDRAISNFKACGYMYWYDWANANWNTKWNAYSQPNDGFADDATEFYFDTAWVHPVKLISQASALLPDVTFEILYADEDTGSNCGTYIIKGGGVLESDIAPSWSDQSAEQKKKYTAFAFSIKHPDIDPRSYGYDENWEYSDEVYEKYNEEKSA